MAPSSQFIRSPIISVLGHVDHGKTSLLDAIRGSKVASKEAGRITQMVGASYISIGSIEDIVSPIKSIFKTELNIPGLLFIDTPGHEAFSSLRERGGSICDMAILVIDILQGIQPQTIESIKILREYKTPFVIAANKIDALDGWRDTGKMSFLESLGLQRDGVKELLDDKVYGLIGALSEQGMNAERFDRVKDFTKEFAIIPLSAKTKTGIAELLLLISGMSQKYLGPSLYVSADEPVKGTVIEVKELKGLGTTADVIVYNGVLRKGDEMLFIGQDGVIKAKIRGLLMPNVSSNNPNEKYIYVDSVVAAAGVKLFAPGLENVIPGSPCGAVGGMDEQELANQRKSIIFEKGNSEGLFVKTDSLGSAEALIKLLQGKSIPISKVGVGPVSREDIMFAKTMGTKNKFFGAILAFNVKIGKDILEISENESVKIIANDIIYRVIEEYELWKKDEEIRIRNSLKNEVAFPAKMRVLGDCFFRASDPAVCGVEILGGVLKPGAQLMDQQCKIIGELKSIQDKNISIPEALKGMKIAISVSGAVLKKDIIGGMTLYTHLNRHDVALWKENHLLLNEEEKALLKEIDKMILMNMILEKSGKGV
jgi:translation initiation factor 5B